MITAAIAVPGAIVAGFAVYLVTLAIASAFYRSRSAAAVPRASLLVLVPAHNEAELIGRCVASLRDQDYPADRYRSIVVADNCTDQTAAVAQSAGAEVMIRHVPAIRGKGHALRWAMDRILTSAAPPDAIVVVDADSTADRAFLRQLATEFEGGREAVQANDLLLVDSGVGRAALDGAALLLRNGVRLAGRVVLGLPAALCGNGMLLSCTLLRRHPWSAFTATEDGEYSLTLRGAGVNVGFARGALIYAQATSDEASATTQGLRWDAGRFYLMRRWLPKTLAAIVLQHRWDLVGEAVDLAMPPFGILVMATVTGVTLSVVLTIAHAIGPAALLPWALASILIPGYVVIGLRAARAPASFYASLFLLGPLFISRKLRIYRRLLRGFEMTHWVRTARPAESNGR